MLKSFSTPVDDIRLVNVFAFFSAPMIEGNEKEEAKQKEKEKQEGIKESETVECEEIRGRKRKTMHHNAVVVGIHWRDTITSIEREKNEVWASPFT